MTTLFLLAILTQQPQEGSAYSNGDGLSYRQQMAAMRRENERQRRIVSRQMLPRREYTTEQRAQTWVVASDNLMKWGLSQQAAVTRQNLMRLYPDSDAAKAAQEWLWERGY